MLFKPYERLYDIGEAITIFYLCKKREKAKHVET